MKRLRVGISGWTYADWRGSFYPKKFPQKKELEFASRSLDSIEINGTFYSLQKPESFQRWYAETPDDFCFSVKAPRFITHIRRLKDVGEPVANFFASGLFHLKEKLGPILWQFPPNLTLKDDRFKIFLDQLPKDSRAAAKMAKMHSARLNGRSFTEVHGDFPLRHAFEFRHPSFMDEKFLDLLREHKVAVVFGHFGAPGWPYMEDLTSDFFYARMHGHDARCAEGYPDSALKEWADRVSVWLEGSQVEDAQVVCPPGPKLPSREGYVYFDNDAKAFAPRDALRFIELMKKRNQLRAG